MRFVLTPVGSAGDVHPFVGIGRGLAARGHDVVVVTAAPFEAAVTGAGLAFHPAATAAEFDAVSRHPDLWHPVRGLRLLLREIGSHLRTAYAALQELCEPGRTVLVGHSLSLSNRVFEEIHGVPAATLHLAPSIFRSDYLQPAHAPGRDGSAWPRWLKRTAWWAADRLLMDPPIVPALNAWRRELGLAPVDRVFRHWLHSPQRVIGLFPDWFAPPQPDWPAALRLTGFPLYDESDRHAVSVEVQRFLDAGDPPVVCTPGSANQTGGAFFRAVLGACERLGRRAILLTRYPQQLPDLPPSALHGAYVPLSALLPRSAALVHHGGIGTLAQGLAAGVPQVTMPMGFDQPDNATRLERLGVGGWVRPREFSPDRVAEALRGLLENRATATACRRWAQALEPRDAVARTCDLLEELAGRRPA
jgi:rhamnosyltransferase subunit B